MKNKPFSDQRYIKPAFVSESIIFTLLSLLSIFLSSTYFSFAFICVSTVAAIKKQTAFAIINGPIPTALYTSVEIGTMNTVTDSSIDATEYALLKFPSLISIG